MEDISKAKVDSLVPLLRFLRLNGKPLTLDRHFMFEPFFRLVQPKRLIYMCGRQMGKCLEMNELVRLSNGLYKKACELKVGDEVSCVDASLKAVSQRILNIFDNGEQSLLRIETRMGSEFSVTPNHKLLTYSGYVAASELSVGTRLASLCRHASFQGRVEDKARIAITAYLIGDGSTTHRDRAVFTANPGEALDEFIELAGDQACVAKCRAGTPAKSVRLFRHSIFIDYLREDGILGCYSDTKFIPDWVFDLSREDTILFLTRLWATDGHIGAHAPRGAVECSYSSASRKLAMGVRSLLIKFGIPASITRRKTTCKGRRCLDSYVVRVETRKGLELFKSCLPVPGKPFPEIPESTSNNNRDTLPFEVIKDFESLFEDIKHKRGDTLRKNGFRAKQKYPPTMRKTSELLAFAVSRGLEGPITHKIRCAAFGDVRWDEIVSIQPVNAARTLDIEVDTHHNFILDGIVSHNSLSLASQGVIQGAVTPYFHTLFVQPRYEQAKRFSTKYVDVLLSSSDTARALVDRGREKSIYEKVLANGSTLNFSYAFLDPDRLRGFAVAKVAVDEAQDINEEFLPVIEECTSAQEETAGFLQFSGTPLTNSNTLSKLFKSSSMAEWVTPCGCGKENIASLSHDLERMIGKETCVCAKCGSALDVRKGFFVHSKPSRRGVCEGYHVPQAVHPIHCWSKVKWKDLRGKMEGPRAYSKAKFNNEILGEPCDEGAKPFTEEDIRAASHRSPNTMSALGEHLKGMGSVVMGVDWSGFGASGESTTAIAIAGVKPPSDEVVCMYGERFPPGLKPEQEAQRVIDLAKMSRASYIAHDFSGAGMIREAVLIQSGYPASQIIPFQLVFSPSSRKVIAYYKGQGGRSCYNMDKTRSLMILFEMIKRRKVTLPDYDTCPDLLNDLMAILQETHETPRGSSYTLMIKEDGRTDDFTHALNFAASAIWHIRGVYPSLVDTLTPAICEEELIDPMKAQWS